MEKWDMARPTRPVTDREPKAWLAAGAVDRGVGEGGPCALLQELEALPADATAGAALHGQAGRASTMRRSIPWCWRCPSPGRARSRSTPAACTREHAGKSSARIVDFVDEGHPALLRMRERRQRGYQAMEYRLIPQASGLFDPGD